MDERERELEQLRARVRELEGLHGIGPGALPLGQGLVEREALLREAERIAELGSWVWDVPNARITWSEQMYRIFGYDPQTTTPSAELFFGRVHPEDIALVQANGQRVASGESRVGSEPDRARLVLPGGELRYVELDGRAVQGPDGAPLRIVGTVRDITAQVETNQALNETRTMLRALGDLAGFGTWLWDVSKHSVEWSRGLRRLLGVELDMEPSIEAFIERVHPEDAESIRATTRNALDPSFPITPTTFRIVRDDGEIRHVYSLSHRLDQQQGPATRLAGLLLDVTERQSLEQQLRQAQKLEAVGALANGIAHDFNNYLMIVGANAEMLEMELDAEGEGEEGGRLELLQEIMTATDRCQVLVKQLLGFSRKQPVERTTFPVNALVEDFAKLAEPLLGEIELAQELESSAGSVCADRTQLEQVLINLAINARDAMPEGGRLTLRSSSFELSPGESEMYTQLEPGPHVRIEVIDTGTGIPEDVRERVFEPFFTTKATGAGSGLGLSTTFRIVQDAGGVVLLDSVVGEGTRFELLLPRAD